MFNGPNSPFQKIEIEVFKILPVLDHESVSDPIFLLLLQTTREQRLFFLCCG